MPCVQVGFWKDLLQLLLRLCLGEDGWKAAAEHEAERKISSGANRKERRAAKLRRLREWQASLKEAASTSSLVYASADSSRPRAGEEGDEAAARQPEGSKQRHRRVGPHGRRQFVRRGMRAAVARAAVKKGAPAAGPGEAFADCTSPPLVSRGPHVASRRREMLFWLQRLLRTDRLLAECLSGCASQLLCPFWKCNACRGQLSTHPQPLSVTGAHERGCVSESDYACRR